MRGAFDDLLQESVMSLSSIMAKNRECRYNADKITDRGGRLMADLTGDSTWLALDCVDDATYQMMEDE